MSADDFRVRKAPERECYWVLQRIAGHWERLDGSHASRGDAWDRVREHLTDRTT